MIQLVILFIFVVFVIIIIQLYKKYIKIKNVVDEEQNKKYSKVREAVGSNNERIKDMKKQAKEIVNDEKADASSLDSRVSANKQQIASNRDIIVDRNFETINSVFKYDSGLVIGGTAGHMRVGDNNIRLNVQNPTQVRVCSADNNCTNIITRKMVEDTWPTQISSETTSPPSTTTTTTPTTTPTTTTPADGGGGANCSSAQVDGLTISSDNVVSTTDEISGITISNIIGESNTGLTTIFPAILRNLVGGNYIGFDVTFSGQTYTGELLSITDINEGAYIQTSDPTGTIVKTYDIIKDSNDCYIITLRT